MNAICERTMCPYCAARKGEGCQTASGRARDAHAARWDEYKRRYRSEEMVFELRSDDPRFKLSAGDRLLCIKYPYDAKVTVLRRISDGFDPECNQYLNDVKFIGFANEMEAS